MELDVIREIPGYKVILKAILKSQIQQLVEQLASHTDEESVFLTASITDGTLSHLGSDSGKSFLQDHDDIKSQFLGFCLKKHHRKKQQEIEDERMKKAAEQRPSPQFHQQRSPLYPSPRQSPHPVALSLASPTNIRGIGLRHEPYPTRPRRPNFDQNRVPAPGTPVRLPSSSQVIKIEPDDPDSAIACSSTEQAGDLDKTTSSIPSSPSQTISDTHIKSETPKETDANSESSVSTIPNEPSESNQGENSAAGGEGLNLDTDILGLLPQTDDTAEGDPQQPSTPHMPTSAPQTPGSNSELDPNVNVKLESLTESEMDLEITGVEMGPSTSAVDPMSSQDSWGADMQGTMGYAAAGGATGSSSDFQMGQRDYTEHASSIQQRFKLVSADELAMLKEFQNSRRSQRDYSEQWAVKIFKEWMAESRNESVNFAWMPSVEMDQLLQEFYAGVRTKEGQNYSKASLIGLRASLNRYLTTPPISRKLNLMTDREFKESNKVLYGVIKRLKNKCKDSARHKKAISEKDMQTLYQCGIFSIHNPQTLQNKVIFDVLCHFEIAPVRDGLRSFRKQSFIMKSDQKGRRYVAMNRDSSDSQSQASKSRMYENDTEFCPVTSFEKYMSKLNPSVDDFFQKPLENCEDLPIWYSNHVVGVNTLSSFMSRMSKSAKLDREYTNKCIKHTWKHNRPTWLLNSKPDYGSISESE